MIAVLQRVLEAKVVVDGNIVGQIGHGGERLEQLTPIPAFKPVGSKPRVITGSVLVP